MGNPGALSKGLEGNGRRAPEAHGRLAESPAGSEWVLPRPPGRDSRCYVTVLSTDSYLDGVLALHASLLRSGCMHPLVVLAGVLVKEETIAVLESAGLKVQRIEHGSVHRVHAPNNVANGKPHWNYTFEKLSVFSITAFSKVVYLDADMIVMRCIDQLFDWPHLSAVCAGRGMPGNEHWVTLNSGLMVIEPAEQAARHVLALLPGSVQRREAGVVGDQDVIHDAFPHWQDMPELHLPERYNVFAAYLDYYVRHLRYPPFGKDGIRVIHFNGSRKPWLLTPAGRIRHCARLLKRGRWYECAAVLIHAHLARAGRKLARRSSPAQQLQSRAAQRP